MDSAVGKGMNGVVFGQDAYTDLDFADDISLLAELLSLLIPVLEAFTEEAAATGLEVNRDKTEVKLWEPSSQTQRHWMCMGTRLQLLTNLFTLVR